jgi:hypothetical protein
MRVFESDWAMLMARREEAEDKMVPARAAKRLAKAVVRSLPLEPLVERALKQALTNIPDVTFTMNKFEHRLEDGVREALEDAVSHIVRETLKAEAQT